MKFDCIIGSSTEVLTNYIAEQLNIPIVQHARPGEKVIVTQPAISEGAFNVFAMEKVYAPQIMEHFDLLVSPYCDVVQACNKLGFYCMYIPFTFKISKLTRGSKILAPSLTEEMILQSTSALHIRDCKFIAEDWATALDKEIIVCDDAFSDYFSGASICLVDRPDSFYAQYARACGVPCDKPACTAPSKSWQGINYKRIIAERDAMQRYQRWQK